MVCVQYHCIGRVVLVVALHTVRKFDYFDMQIGAITIGLTFTRALHHAVFGSTS
jgi:hypothetical protein